MLSSSQRASDADPVPANHRRRPTTRLGVLLRRLTGSFQAKIFVLFSLVTLAILLVSFALVNRRVGLELENTISHELGTQRAALAGILRLEEETRLVAVANIASSPRLVAALSTNDPATIQHELEKVREAWGSDIFAIADADGRLLASAGFPARDRASAPILRRALAGEQVTDVLVLSVNGGQVDRVAAFPIRVPEKVVGAALIGDALGRRELEGLQNSTDCDLTLVSDDRVLASTVPENLWRDLVTGAHIRHGSGRLSPHMVRVGGERIQTVTLPLNDEVLDRPVLLLSKSVDRARTTFLAPITRDTLLLGLLTLIALLAASLAIARSVTRPVRALVGGARALEAGDLDFHLAVSSRDELGYLARAFDAMRLSLKAKIDELSEVNRDLADRMEELRRAQETLVRSEKLAATGTLVAQLSHELNNPIHNLQNCMEVIRRRLPEGDERRQFAEMALSEIARMARLTRQLLDFHRPSRLTLADVNVASVVRETLSMSDADLRAAHVRAELTSDPSLPTVRASADHLKQVFLNLVLNAVEAMPQGGRLSIRAERDGDAVAVCFQDEGGGIHPEHRSQIFDAFFTTKGAVSGVGLGLSVSWSIVREHGGTIDVADAPGGGTIFTVRLPRDGAQDESMAGVDEERTRSAASGPPANYAAHSKALGARGSG
jgi:C4-dicarboxylate-specific signal transduction histidine kinase